MGIDLALGSSVLKPAGTAVLIAFVDS